jgi:hypothetical protein
MKRPLIRPTSSSTLRPQLAVLADLAATRDGDLHEGDASAQVAALLEQQLDRPQALDDPLRVVEPVDAEQNAAAAELRLQPAQRALGCARASVLTERCGVDRDRVRGRAHAAACQNDRAALDADVVAQARACAQEVLAICLCLERDDVGAEQSLQQLGAPR